MGRFRHNIGVLIVIAFLSWINNYDSPAQRIRRCVTAEGKRYEGDPRVLNLSTIARVRANTDSALRGLAAVGNGACR